MDQTANLSINELAASRPTVADAPNSKIETAANRVLSLPELLERILASIIDDGPERLPDESDDEPTAREPESDRSLRQLFAMQRVCRFWRNVIATSLQLQCLLHMKPSPRPCTNSKKKYCFFNPLRRFCDLDCSWLVPDRAVDFMTISFSYANVEDLRRDPAFSREEASWRNMLISQPPPADVQVYHNSNLHSRDGASVTFDWIEKMVLAEQERRVRLCGTTEPDADLWSSYFVINFSSGLASR